MAIKQDLVQKRNELEALNVKLKKVREECLVEGGDFDLMKSTGLDGDLQKRVNDMRTMKTKQDALGAEVDGLVEALKAFDPQTEPALEPVGMAHGNPQAKSIKSLGEMFVDSKEFKAFAAEGGNAHNIKMNFGEHDLKTLMTTAAGFAPPVVRTGEVEGYPVESIGLFDLIPKGMTSQAAYTFMRQNLRTQAAAEKAETAAYAESAFTWEQVSQTVEDIGHWIPITGAQLEDVPQIRGIVDTDLRDGLRERLDYQLYNGSGSTPSLQGLLALTGIGTEDAAAIPTMDAFYKAIVNVQKNGFAQPNIAFCNGTDWSTVQLMKTDDGQYIWGHPADVGPMRVWGVRLVSTFRVAQGTAGVGDFSKMLYAERKGITVEITDSHDTYFIYGKYAIRANTRGVFVWKRPSAFCKITNVH